MSWLCDCAQADNRRNVEVGRILKFLNFGERRLSCDSLKNCFLSTIHLIGRHPLYSYTCIITFNLFLSNLFNRSNEWGKSCKRQWTESIRYEDTSLEWSYYQILCSVFDYLKEKDTKNASVEYSWKSFCCCTLVVFLPSDVPVNRVYAALWQPPDIHKDGILAENLASTKYWVQAVHSIW